MTRAARIRRRQTILFAVLMLCALLVARPSPAAGAYWTVPKLVKHAAGNPFRCKVARHWGPKQNRCVVRTVWLDRPAIGAQAERIIDCETGGTWDEGDVNGRSGATGLAQFLRSTWRAYRWRHKSPKHPVFNVLQMRVVRMADGDWHQWVCRP